MFKFILPLSSLVFVFSSTVNAQTCKKDFIKETHPKGQYLINDDGTVTDIVNGFMFQLCSVGQVFNEEDISCTGQPTTFLDWPQALHGASQEMSFAGYDDWRIPNIKELSSLVERACVAPAIDLSVFVSTPSSVYWSSTFDHTSSYNNIVVQGRVVNFADGTEVIDNVSEDHFIRLIRSLPKE